MGLSTAEAAEILGITEHSAFRLIHQGILPKTHRYERNGLDRDVVERVALDRWRHPGHPYWATRQEAADILGVSLNRVTQLVDTGKIPALRHNGRWFFRRQQRSITAPGFPSTTFGVCIDLDGQIEPGRRTVLINLWVVNSSENTR